MIGVSTDSLRDWRRRGLIDTIGTKDGKRGWKYSVIDVAALWTGLFMGMYSNFELARVYAGVIATTIVKMKADLPIKHYDYAVDEIEFGDMCIFSAAYSNERQKVVLLDSLADAPKKFTQAAVINLAQIYGQMPSGLREAMFVADVNGERSGKEGAKSLAKHRPQEDDD